MGTTIHENLAVNGGPKEADVALALDLPILTGVSPKEAMCIREHEAASFDRFRNSLRDAITSRIERSHHESSDDIAADIIGDIIGPSLSEIGDILDKANNVLAKKVGTAVTIGSILTFAGLLANIPLLLPAGIALWGGGAVPPMQKYFEEKRDVQLKDMYFLWSREVQARGEKRA
jgi:hypothetical protein